MNDNYNAMETAYNELVKFFTEDPKAMGPDEFFPLFKNFNDAVTVCVPKVLLLSS